MRTRSAGELFARIRKATGKENRAPVRRHAKTIGLRENQNGPASFTIVANVRETILAPASFRVRRYVAEHTGTRKIWPISLRTRCLIRPHCFPFALKLGDYFQMIPGWTTLYFASRSKHCRIALQSVTTLRLHFRSRFPWFLYPGFS